MDKDEVHDILKEIGLSPAEIAVYVALLDGARSAKEIISMATEKRPTVYYCLGSLEKRGLVSKTGKEYGNKFQLEPVENLIESVNKNIRKQNTLLEKTKQLGHFYSKKKSGNKVLISYFDNSESIRSAIFNSLYNKEKSIRSIVPANNLFHEIGTSFIEEYVREKKKRGITTKALWEDIPSKKNE